MFRIKALIALLLLFSVTRALADAFVVTSNADTGPGTLRQALTDAAANGTTTVDIINFNLPVTGDDINARTIRLRSQLPIVTSKVIIDGSTQPSPVLGVSGARVIIEREFTTQYYSGLVISNSTYDAQTTDVEIYGLYLRGFANITSLANVNTSQGSGIIIEYRVNNIIIGKPGKGNVICGNVNGIVIRNTGNYYTATTPAIRTITIQSNFIGVMDNGNTVNTNWVGINAADLYENSLTIGGDNANEGNTIAGNGTDILINRSSYNSSFRSTITINGNKIGTDYNGTVDYKGLPIFSQSSSVEMYGIKVNAMYTDLNIFKNVISGHQSAGISIANSDFMIGGNYIGTDKNGTGQLGNTVGIRIEGGAQGKIGGSAAADPNYIGYNTFGVDVASEKTVTITRNSIYCNERFGIGQALKANQAFIQVLKQRNNYISGKANANAEVELFYSDNCPGSCQGKQYIATVRADNSGRWEYNGTLSNHVVATASLNSYVTSMFSTAALLTGEALVEPYTCNGPGSITITEPREGITFEWYKLELNGASVKIPVSATTQKITGLEVGTYELRISDGCRTVPQTFSVTDQILIKPVITAPAPQCGQTSFSFSANSFRGKGTITYTWYNATNQMVGYGSQVSLPQGTYTVKAADEAGCTLTSDPVTIVRRPAPVINTTAMKSTAAACGQPNGSIKGITLTDVTGTATFQWYFYNMQTREREQPVGAQTIDLEGVEGGYYQLEVKDEGGCTPVYSNPLYISIYNSVVINIGTVTGTTCDLINGQVIGTTIQEADSYKLTNAIGTVVEQGPYLGIPIDFIKLSAGSYTLTASNTVSGCSYPMSFTVPRIVPQDYSFTANPVKTTCGLNNGSITLSFTNNSARPSRFEWRDETAQPLTGTQTQIKDLAPGTYTYIAYDVNGCDKSYTYIIGKTDLLDINESGVKPVNDYCGLKRGSVKGLQVSGGVPGHTFKWIDENDKQVGSTLDLLNIGEGKYRLVLGDQTSCGTAISSVYTILDESRPMDDPVAGDIRVCYTTEIMIAVTNAEEGTYQLFKDPSDATALMESDKGIFIFTAAKSSDYYIRRTLGHCIGNFTKMHVEVTNDNLVIANTMTPNGDGINDIWSLTGLPDYPDITIQVYSRDGQLVYDAIGSYSKPFDGHFRGAELPAGVYYYKIDLRGDCKPLSGSLTLLR